MGGFFGVASKTDCIRDVYFGTDYHSHLGTMRGGMAGRNSTGINRAIHDISNTPFRSKFEGDLDRLHGETGIGVISDTDDQPVIVRSHLGIYAVVTVAKVNNVTELATEAFRDHRTHFAEMGGGEINPTELVTSIISRETSITDGIRAAQEKIEGSCSLLVLTDEGIYAARDRLGRTHLLSAAHDGPELALVRFELEDPGSATRELVAG